MTRVNLTTFDPFQDFQKIKNYTIGVDRLFNQLAASAGSTSNNYPPYNIVKKGEYDYAIEVAVAGFEEEDLEVGLHDGTLTILGEKKQDSSDDEYIVKGIGTRSFSRIFTVIDTVKVVNVILKGGILTIHLTNQIPEEKKPQKFQIQSK